MWELPNLFAPLGREWFREEVFGRKPFHFPGEPSRFAHLMSWDDLNTLLGTLTDSSNFRLVKENKPIPQERYLKQQHSWLAQVALLDAAAVSRELRAGATIVINQMEKMHSPVSDLCRSFEREFASYFDVVLFASCRATQGFNTHWDLEEVFIFQILGEKHWRLFENGRPHPTERDRTSLTEAPEGAPYWEGTLRAGDVLYIPNGWWHQVVALDSPTLHISFGSQMPTGLDLAQEMIHALDQHESLRAVLPLDADAMQRQAYLQEFRELARAAVDEVSLDEYLLRRARSAPARGRLSLPWSAQPDCETFPVQGSAWIHWLSPRTSQLAVSHNEAALHVAGSEFKFSKDAAVILEDLMAGSKTRFDALCQRHPQIAENAIEKFLMHLVSSGLVAIAQTEHV